LLNYLTVQCTVTLNKEIFIVEVSFHSKKKVRDEVRGERGKRAQGSGNARLRQQKIWKRKQNLHSRFTPA
jgi:hypothetical protein